MLTIGQKVKTWLANETLTVQKKLGEGGQGSVYLVQGASYGQKALKWYNETQATKEQKNMIIDLINQGKPDGIVGDRFVWPIDLVEGDRSSNRFGYIMDIIDHETYSSLGEVWANIKPAPSFSTMCKISYRMAESFRKLHLAGYCYRDISIDNLLFNSTTGDILICDNDNVGVNGDTKSQILGTMEYMAPEIIVGKASPSTETDLHSLAVLLFQLWIWHHPFHGMMEYIIRSWDLAAKTKVYGENPVFIFDPTNDQNGLPNDPEYDTARERWKLCPDSLKQLFIRAFTVGLKDPSQRVTEGEWVRLFMKLEHSIISCPHDRAENIWDSSSTIYCWYCGKQLSIPPRFHIKSSDGIKTILLTSGVKIMNHDLYPLSIDDESLLIAEVVQNPKKPNVWGLKNHTTTNWIGTKKDGSTIIIEPGRAAILTNELTIDFGSQVVGKVEG